MLVISAVTPMADDFEVYKDSNANEENSSDHVTNRLFDEIQTAREL
jgi:hypothetical protein